MAKFLSHDGVDANGIRAEVMVQTGTGRIKELVGRGKPAEDGSFRNMEVVFEPDNPHLKRKVYALLDTTAKELWDYVQAAHKDQRDIAYRIESQRKRGIDRTKKFDDLVHTEEAVRILAAIDTVLSHEAKTNPKEDPSGEKPSALDQDVQALTRQHSGGAGGGIDAVNVIEALKTARKNALPASIVDALTALALTAGVDIQEAMTAGLENPEATVAPSEVNRYVAIEEKPWMPFNSDGRANVGSYMVAHAASAEQFALDHLITVYSEGKKTNVDVSDTMIAQAASIALVILEAADEVQAKATEARADRQKNSYNRALALVFDAVAKRYPVPVGGNHEAQEEWRTAVITEAAERLYGVIEVAQGRLPKPEAERGTTPVVEVAEKSAPAVETPAETVAEKPAAAKAKKAEETIVEAFDAKVIETAETSTAAPASFKAETIIPSDSPEFITPTDELVNRVRTICTNADATSNPTAVSDWLERCLGARATRKVHAPTLEAFVTFYEAAGPAQVRKEILG